MALKVKSPLSYNGWAVLFTTGLLITFLGYHPDFPWSWIACILYIITIVGIGYHSV